MGNSPSKVPLALNSTGLWAGNDGNWSTLVLSVGNPPQDFQAVVAVEDTLISVPSPTYCGNASVTDCGALRGIFPVNGSTTAGPGFQTEESTTWSPDPSLPNRGSDYMLNATYKAMGTSKIALIAGSEPWMAVFGAAISKLGSQAGSDAKASVIQALKSNSFISSFSFGYTAGASYQSNPSSLVLGGYDSSRFIPHNISFDMSGSGNPFAMNLTSLVTAMGDAGGNSTAQTQILTQTTPATLNTSTPFLSLPPEACGHLETQFGLQLDAATGLYLVNETMHAALLAAGGANLTFTFRSIGKRVGEIALTLPYASFDLEASYPFYPVPTRYFPLRVAANASDVSLGRTFFQQAYLIADYTRKNFSMHATVATPLVAPTLVPIDMPGLTLVGKIVLGVLAIIFGSAFLLLIYSCIGESRRWARRRRRARQLTLIWEARHRRHQGDSKWRYRDQDLRKLLGEEEDPEGEE